MNKKSIPFTKLHGLGNDFVLLDFFDDRLKGFALTQEWLSRIADRNRGIGFDQLLALKPAQSQEADLRMEIFNSDGSQASMCGNGIRAVALYLKNRFRKFERIETLGGPQIVTFRDPGFRVNMGVPKFVGNRGQVVPIPDSGGLIAPNWEIDVGNPHAVFLVKMRPSNNELEKWGRATEVSSRYPNRTNVEFVTAVSRSCIEARVWERGAGITLACGTGATASAVAAIAAGICESPVRVSLLGGELEIEWNSLVPKSEVFMTGTAEEVFSGVVPMS